MQFTLLDCLVGMFGDMIDQFGPGLDVAGILAGSRATFRRRRGGRAFCKGVAMTGHVAFTVEDGIGQILIDRADKMNAITPEMTRELQQHLPRHRR